MKRSSKISKLTFQKLIWVDRCTVAASRYGSIQPKSDLEHHPRCTRRTCRRVDHTLHGRGKNPVIVWFRVLIVGHAVVTVIVQIPCVFSSERYAFRCAIHRKYLFLSKKITLVPRLAAVRRRSWAIVWPPNAKCESRDSNCLHFGIDRSGNYGRRAALCLWLFSLPQGQHREFAWLPLSE